MRYLSTKYSWYLKYKGNTNQTTLNMDTWALSMLEALISPIIGDIIVVPGAFYPGYINNIHGYSSDELVTYGCGQAFLFPCLGNVYYWSIALLTHRLFLQISTVTLLITCCSGWVANLLETIYMNIVCLGFKCYTWILS
jgi:hypothetical protein